jgi:hypothetical protein
LNSAFNDSLAADDIRCLREFRGMDARDRIFAAAIGWDVESTFSGKAENLEWAMSVAS